MNPSAHPFSSAVSAAAAVVAVLAGCITVNVNFPESAVKRAADDFVRDLYKGTGDTAVADAAAEAEAAADAEAAKAAMQKTRRKSGKVPAAAPKVPAKDAEKPTSWRFDLLIGTAHAQELNTNTPKAGEIKSRMRTRVGEVSKWKDKGVICETEDGMIRASDLGKAAGQAGAVNKLIKEENADRDELYEEIQSANSITDRKQTKIRKFFAAAFRAKGSPCAD